MGAEKVIENSRIPRYTYREWERWEGDWELVQGIPYYLILHPDEEWVRVLRLRDGQWETLFEGRDGQQDFDLGHCAFRLDFGAIW